MRFDFPHPPSFLGHLPPREGLGSLFLGTADIAHVHIDGIFIDAQ